VTALLAGAAVALAVLGAADLAVVLRGRVAGRPARASPVARLLARIGRGFGGRAPRGLAARIAAAGLHVPASDVMAIKAGAGVTGLAAGVVLAPAAPGRSGVLLVAAAPLAGFLGPDAWLRRRTHARAAAMEAELAGLLDLLRVALAAGLSPQRALAEVGRRHPGVLAAELRAAAARVALGTPTAHALAELERRCPAAGVHVLVAGLRRAERHGAPLGPALEAQAAQARARSTQRTAEAAARAAPQIQLVVALLLVPSVLLLVAAALVPALTGG
jgi:tight adherence protein C